MPLTPLQTSNDTFEEEQGLLEVEDQMWSAKEKNDHCKNETVHGSKLQRESGG